MTSTATTPRATHSTCISNFCSCSYETKLKITIATAVTTVALGILTSLPVLIAAGVLTGTYALYKTFQHVDLLYALAETREAAFNKALSLHIVPSTTPASAEQIKTLKAKTLETEKTLQDIFNQLDAQKVVNKDLDTKNQQLQEQHVTIAAELENQKKSLKNANASIEEQQQLLTERNNTIKEQIQQIEDLLGQIPNIEEELSTTRIRASHKALHYMIEIVENFRSNVLLGINAMTDKDKVHWEACYEIMIFSIRAFAEDLNVLSLLSDKTDSASSPSAVLSQVLAIGPIDAPQKTPAKSERNPFPSLSPDQIQVSPTTAAASPNGTA